MINNQNKNLSVMKESLKNPYLIHYSGNKNHGTAIQSILGIFGNTLEKHHSFTI